MTIKGFKSFADRTHLEFSPGVSVIVGPNGCGKSNITDALLWALGEQSPSTVRGQSMRDMVFSGGEGRGPAVSAEVEVVLSPDPGEGLLRVVDDSRDREFSELSITRRLDRNGDGGYMLNGARCRLVDVLEALSDAGLGSEMHSVISQGKVEEIVNSKPRQRRLLIEEAAGLGKHRKRRRRAQLKLERTRDNLDRALDVEREARSRLRPLKRQAEAADIHARLQRQSDELRAELLASELAIVSTGSHDVEERLAKSRAERQVIEAELKKVGERRSAAEQKLAERDRTRTEAWGRLTAVRSAHERLTVRVEALTARQIELQASIERRRATLGSLASEFENEVKRAGGDPVSTGIDKLGDLLEEAAAALAQTREATDTDERLTGLARAAAACDRGAQTARRIENLLGRSRQDSLETRVESESEILASLLGLCEAAAGARDAVGRRAADLEGELVGVGEDDSDTIATELRECSRADAELQSKLRAVNELLTSIEVSASQSRHRKSEIEAELAKIAARLKRELAAAETPLDDGERRDIEARIERLSRRREQLGPVNPLAADEYEEALAHVKELEEQRTDLEQALTELKALIRETDKKITSSFEETLESAAKNFSELIEHVFPGGRGRLRMVDDAPPKLVVAPVAGAGAGGAEGATDAAVQVAAAEAADAAAAEAEDEASDPAEPDFDTRGVEIEVNPAGKAMRRLSLLSGGEKSLVALAFVFAVFLARPSPFYVLDEVEAALDDANIDRFLQLVRRFADRAQFIVVTHQRRTMDAADVLYGVSMGTGGVTKVVSRRMDRDRDRSGSSSVEAA